MVLIPNLEGHLNCNTGSKGMAISLNGWILPTGGVALVLGLRLRLALHKSNMALHNKCVLLIKDFHVLGPGPSSLGHTSFLGPSFYKALRPGVGATTPSRMKGKAW